MSDSRFKLAVCQVRTELEKRQTMDKAEAMVREAAENGAAVVALPEMFSCPYTRKYFDSFAEPQNGESVGRMSCWAREYGVILVGGSIPEREGKELYNTCFVFDKTGKIIARHRKAHMFDVDIAGGITFKESDYFTPGDDICVFDTEYGRMGVAICFDMRFPELIRAMAKRGAEIIIVPAQFNMTTGPAHWELLFRQRAVDTQCFTVGTSPARDEWASYVAWGHSMVCDPWGTVLHRCDAGEEVAVTELELSRVDEVRRQLPILSARRTDVYELRKK